MKFADRRTLAAAYDWRREREAILRAQISIESSLLRSLRTELFEVRQLNGRELSMRFRWESPSEIAEVMRPKLEFQNELRSLGLRAEYRAEFNRGGGVIAR